MFKRVLGISIIAASLIHFASPAAAIDDMEVAKRFCKLGRKDAQQAISACTDYINKGDPAQKHHAYLLRGLAYTTRRWWDPAFADFDAAVKLNPKFAEAYNNRGWVYLQTGRPQEALADFDRAIALEQIPRYLVNRELALKAIAKAQ